MLARHDLVPHLRVRTVDGTIVDYRADVWQQRNLVLVAAGHAGALASRGAGDFVTAITAQRDAFTALNTALVVAAEPVPGVPHPGVLVADRWGEIQMVSGGTSDAPWPAVDDVLATVTWIEMKCPECEGEAK